MAQFCLIDLIINLLAANCLLVFFFLDFVTA